MSRCCWLLVVLLSMSSLSAVAQPAANAAAAPASADAAAAKGFDFLLGKWQVEVHPKVSGLVAMIHGTPRLIGSWTAQRSADGSAIEDELNVVDASGNPISSLASTRRYVAAKGRWYISGNDHLRGRSSDAEGNWKDGEMVLEGRIVEADGKFTLTRTHFFDIGTAGFRTRQDRSTDNGQTWDTDAQTMDAKRVGMPPAS